MLELTLALKRLQQRFEYLKLDEPLAPHTYWKVGGPARAFLHPPTTDEFIRALDLSRDLGIRTVVIGGGSNILVSDNGFEGLVIRAGGRDCEQLSERTIQVGAGVPLSTFLNFAAQAGLSVPSVELFVGVPGTIGAAIFGNIGGVEVVFGLFTKEVTYWDNGTIHTISGPDCEFGYRTSRFKQRGGIVLSGVFRLNSADPVTIRTAMEKGLKQKRETQPLNLPSGGSVFKHPEGMKAWKLIDDAGLRGKQIGGAQISDMHANFIVNKGNATAEDVVILISLIKQQVRDKFNIQLTEEIQYIGF